MRPRCSGIIFLNQRPLVRRSTMNRLSIIAVTTASLILGVSLAVGSAVSQQNAQPGSDVEGVNAASQVFIAAISARDISAIDKVWAHEPYATFIGPLSTTVVVGWDGVRKAWEMRFSQFDRVTISLVVLRHKTRRILLLNRRAQYGHLGSALAIATIKV